MTATPDEWQIAEDMAKKHDESSSIWLKLANDGDKAVVVFLGGPYPREMCFVDGKYVAYDDAQKAAGHKPALRVAVNVALLDTKDVKVLEQGVTFFKDLVRIRQKYGLDKWAFEIERHGAAKDPKTTYSILPEQQLSTAQIAEFQALPLHDLVELYAAAEHDELDSYDRKADGNPPAVSSGTPAVTAPPSSPAVAPRAPRAETPAVVDGATAQALATPLKALPREAVERFCTTFGIARIKDLPAAQAAKARSVVDALVAEYDAPPPVPEDVDPFG